jgi:hypothetical protein
MKLTRSEYFVERQRECEQLLQAIEARHLRLIEEHAGWRRDLTEEYRQQLRAHCEAYQRALALLEATGEATKLAG